MQLTTTEKQPNKLTHNEETKERAHNTQIVRGKENLKLSYDGTSQRQASGTNQTDCQLYIRAVIESEKQNYEIYI